jgi:hypothetical protein
MSEDGDNEMRLPVIRWTPGMTVPKPEGHVPRFIEVGLGEVIDEALLPWILDALLAEHPDAERLREITREQPGLNLEREGDMILVRLSTGEPVGLFDRRVLDA